MEPSADLHPRVLVLGSGGMLGRDLLRRFRDSGIPVLGLGSGECDITRRDRVAACVESRPWGAVINCAAYTAVDRAEAEPGAAFRVNRDGAAHVAEACRRENVPLIHLSTDYVFDGQSRVPYREEDPARPVSVYGRSKWEGEEAVRDRSGKHLVVRTAWLYAAHGQNFVTSVLHIARRRKELRVVDDQFGCPTWTEDLAEGLVSMVRKVLESPKGVPWGTYHLCGGGFTSRHAFARAIVEEGYRREHLVVGRILPVPTDHYPTAARRPPWAVLDCQKANNAFGIALPPWQTGLARMMEELYTPTA